MLKNTPHYDGVEGAVFPQSWPQISGTHIKAQLSAECLSQGAAVFNCLYIPTRTVRGMEEITGPASNFQQLRSCSIAAQAADAAPRRQLTKNLPQGPARFFPGGSIGCVLRGVSFAELLGSRQRILHDLAARKTAV